MSITKNQSRFDILPDDAGDPFETQKKSKKKKKEGGSGDGVKKASKGNVNSDKKQLQNLAFGSASEGKKKKNQNQNQNQQNGNSSSSKDGVPGAKEQKNGNPIRERPKGITDEQWEQWQKRDEDIMDETYASDLQAALLQSKLDFDTEQQNKPVAKGKKKKPVAVSLTDFQARLNEGGTSTATQISSVMNGIGGNVPVYPPQYDDDDLVERFRQEARLELERERRKAIEKQLLMSRQPPPPIQRPVPGQPSPPRAASTPSDEKDLLISRLTDENLRLKSEVDLLKDKVKTINNYLQAAHEVKDKAKLIYDMENMTKANNDLHEELRQVHSQLEQEKSRSSAAMLELRRLLENRRRTNTEGSNP